jgi:3-hydroxybutyrate dehydrogenase
MSSRQPSGRFVGMEGVAGLAAFLCGLDARDINGAQISIDGAWSVA